MFFDETAKIEAHESEVLCVEFTPTESGNDLKKFRKYREATTGFPAKWRQRNERKKFHANREIKIHVYGIRQTSVENYSK